MDITSISSALASIKAAKDIAQSMVNLRDTAAMQAKIIEFQSKILDAQSAASSAQEERATLIERVRNLEQEVARFKQWDTDKQRYELKNWGQGAFACVLKVDATPPEPPHALCVTCYDNGKKSILQFNGQVRIPEMAWHCPSCKAKVMAHSRVLLPKPPVTSA
jgi:Zn finger protein HypA/HybF involved in hydrogenase expression